MDNSVKAAWIGMIKSLAGVHLELQETMIVDSASAASTLIVAMINQGARVHLELSETMIVDASIRGCDHAQVIRNQAGALPEHELRLVPLGFWDDSPEGVFHFQLLPGSHDHNDTSAIILVRQAELQQGM